jgi:hypothetical protein
MILGTCRASLELDTINAFSDNIFNEYIRCSLEAPASNRLDCCKFTTKLPRHIHHQDWNSAATLTLQTHQIFPDLINEPLQARGKSLELILLRLQRR